MTKMFIKYKMDEELNFIKKNKKYENIRMKIMTK